MTEQKLVSPPEAAKLLGIGRNAIYPLIESGEIEVIFVGERRKIPVSSIDAYIASRPRAPHRRPRIGGRAATQRAAGARS